MGDFFSALQALGSAFQPQPGQLSYGDQSQMNNVFNANPDFAAKLYSAKNAATQTQNQSALVNLQAQEDQQKLTQQKAINQAAQQAGGGSPLENLLALASPSSLASYKIEQQKLDADKQRQAAIAQIIGGGSAAPTATAGAASGPSPVSVQNNNPGNMKDPSTGQFQWYSSPEEDTAAMTKDLALKISGKSPAMISQFGEGYTPTLSNLIQTWAPPGENDTQGYINSVAQKTGINPNQPLTLADIGKIQPAMVHQEGGDVAAQYFNPERQPLQAPGIQQSMNAPPATVGDAFSAPASSLQAPTAAPVSNLSAPAPEPQELTQLRQLAMIDPAKYAGTYIKAKAKYAADQQKNADSVITPDNQSLVGQGKAFIDTIQNPDIKNKANAILDARMPFPNITSRTPSNVKAALEAAQAADPTLSAQTYPVRLKTQQAFTTGPESKNFNAINTVVQHLGEWNDSVANLHNTGSQLLNAPLNLTSQIASDGFNGDVKSAKIAAQAVGTEAAKAYHGAGAISQDEIKDWQNSLSSNVGPETRSKVAKQIGTLLVGKIQALNDQWSSAFPTQPRNFLSPQAAKTLQSLGVDTSSLDIGSSAPDNSQASDAPQTGVVSYKDYFK